jgi:hypothetical protein
VSIGETLGTKESSRSLESRKHAYCDYCFKLHSGHSGAVSVIPNGRDSAPWFKAFKGTSMVRVCQGQTEMPSGRAE